MTENISWKKRIKKLQIIFFALLLIAYFVYGYAQQAYIDYTNNKKQLEELVVNKINKKTEELNKTKEKLSILEQLKKPEIQFAFVRAYSLCFSKYIESKYGVVKAKISLSKCVDSKMLLNLPTKYKNYFKDFSDNDIIKVAISLGVWENNLEKFEIDQKRFLASLDQKVFNNKLEDKVEILTLGNPVLLDKKLDLYKVNFTFTTNLNYNAFLSLTNNMQNKIEYNSSSKFSNNLYFNIENVSDFDLTKADEFQKINIQGTFYFTK